MFFIILCLNNFLLLINALSAIFPSKCGINGIGSMPGAHQDQDCYPVFETEFLHGLNPGIDLRYSTYSNDPKIRELMSAQTCRKKFRECEYRLKPEPKQNFSLSIDTTGYHFNRVCVGCPIVRMIVNYDAVFAQFYFDYTKINSMISELSNGIKSKGYSDQLDKKSSIELKGYLSDFLERNDLLKYYLTCGFDRDLLLIYTMAGVDKLKEYRDNPKMIENVCRSMPEPTEDWQRLAIAPTEQEYADYLAEFDQPHPYTNSIEKDTVMISVLNIFDPYHNKYYDDIPTLLKLADQYGIDYSFAQSWIDSHLNKSRSKSRSKSREKSKFTPRLG